jgi:hypothetical protein
VPEPPTNLSATPGNTFALIEFTAGSDGGSPILNYEYSTDDGVTFRAFSPADNTSPLAITTLSSDGLTPLSNGTTYFIRLKAVNANGTSTGSSNVSVTPSTIPDAPTSLSATPGNQEASIYFTAGADGGSPLTNYEYSTDNGSTFRALSPADTFSPVTITTLSSDGVTPLTNGTTYTIRLKAVNANGSSVASSSISVSPSSPSTTPDAPTGLLATAGNAQATISFTPGSDGGSPITNYLYSTNNGSNFVPFSPADSNSPVTITSISVSPFTTLLNGTTYPIRLKASNANGASPASSSVSVTPSTTPNQPTGLSAIPRNREVLIAFTPGFNGGRALTNYQYSTDNGVTFIDLDPPNTTSPLSIRTLSSDGSTRLINNIPYSIKLKSVNPNGTSSASDPISATPILQPGNVDWSTRVSAEFGATNVPNIRSDSYGNVYAVGSYSYDSLTINSYSNVIGNDIVLDSYGTLTNDSPTNTDIFLAKYNSNGSTEWATRIGGSGQEQLPYVATNSNGDVYVTGIYQSESAVFNSFASVSGGSINVTPFGSLAGNSGNYDTFLTRYNSNGIVQWATRIDGGGSEFIGSIDSDNSGNVYLAGYFTSGTTTFNSYVNVTGSDINVTAFGSLTNSGGQDIFFAKYDSNGQAQWATRIDGTGQEASASVATDSSGNVYIAGQYDSSILSINSFSNVTGGSINLSVYGTLSNITGYDSIFLAKYNSAGEVQWVTRIDGTNAIQAPEIKIDSSGNIYITGNYNYSSVNFYSFSNVSGGEVIVSSYGSILNTEDSGAFLAKYNSNGQVQWATKVSGSVIQNPALTIDINGNAYIGGHFDYGITAYNFSSNNSGTIETAAYGSMGTSGYYDFFLAKYNSNGTAQWFTRVGGSGDDDTLITISADPTGYVYMSGQYKSSSLALTDFIGVNSGSVELTTFASMSRTGDPSIFLARYYGGILLPNAPFNLSGVSSNASAIINFTPGSDGGSPITNYLYSTNDGSNFVPFSPADSNSPITITNISVAPFTTLLNGTTYPIRLKASNANGTSPQSSNVSVTPSTTPDAPTNLSATPGTKKATISFTPGSNGGSAITNYQYSTDNGVTFRAFSPAVTTSPVIITTLSSDGTTPLTNEVTYTIRLKAVNANGASSASSPISVTPTPPSGNAVWATSIAGTSVDRFSSVMKDSQGNVYIAGQYNSSPLTLNNYLTDSNGIIYTSTYGTLTNSGGADIFLAKYNSNGIVQWATTISGPSDEEVPIIATDSDDNIYIACHSFSQNVTYNSFSNWDSGNIYLSTFGSIRRFSPYDIYLAKYNSAGSAQWATLIGGFDAERSPFVTADVFGNVYVSGHFNSSQITINSFSNVSSQTIITSSFGFLPIVGTNTFDIFLAKYNSSGVVQWATSIGGNSSETLPVIGSDMLCNVYIAGQFNSLNLSINNFSNVSSGIITISTIGSLSNSGAVDLFLAKYNSIGSAQWVTNITGTGSETDVFLSVFSNQSIYVAGQYDAVPLLINNYSNISAGVIYTSTFGNILSNSGGFDIFLAKYNTSGAAQWTTTMNGIGSETNVAISSDQNDNVYISGTFASSNLSIYNYSNVSNGIVYLSSFGSLSNAGQEDIFLSKFNSSGIAQWATSIGGTGVESFSMPSADTFGNIYITGTYNSAQLTLNNYRNVSAGAVYVSTFGTLSNSGGNDIFLAKYKQ